MRKSNFLLFLIFFSLTICTMLSCGNDPIKGCMDSEAENFDMNATENDGNCTYAADKFIGNYLGSSICDGGALGIVADLNNDSLTFDVSKQVGGGKNDVTVSLEIQGTPVGFAASVTGETLTVDATLPSLPFPDPSGSGIVVNVDLFVYGLMTYDTINNSSSGNIEITINQSGSDPVFQLDMGTCIISGVKQ